jgi:hypothetical protein
MFFIRIRGLLASSLSVFKFLTPLSSTNPATINGESNLRELQGRRARVIITLLLWVGDLGRICIVSDCFLYEYRGFTCNEPVIVILGQMSLVSGLVLFSKRLFCCELDGR